MLETGLVMVELGDIERDITARVMQQVEATGFSRVQVGISGRDVHLDGEVSSDTARRSVLALAASARGVRAVADQLEIVPLRLPHFRLSRYDDGELVLDGEVPTRDDMDFLVGHSRQVLEPDTLDNRIRVSPEVTDATWLDVVPAVLSESRILEQARIEVGAGRLFVGGLLSQARDYSVLLVRVSQFAGSRGLEFHNGIGVFSESDLAALDIDVPPVPGLDDARDGVTDEVTGALEETVARDEQDESDPVDSDTAVAQSTEQSSTESPGESTPVQADTPVAADEPAVDDDAGGDEALAVIEQEDPGDGALVEADNAADDATDDAVEQDRPATDAVRGETGEGASEAALQREILRKYCQQNMERALLDSPFRFGSGETDVTVDKPTVADKIREIIENCPTLNVTIAGHTDSVGNAESNRLLSVARAQSVLEWLVTHGIARARLSARGFGDTLPVASNDSEEGRARNRRIEVIFEL